jgi:hypothetical protein
MALLSKEQLLAKEELKVEKVPLGKDHVFVRQMNAREHSKYSQLLTERVPVLEDGKPTGDFTVKSTMDDWPSKLASCTLCDEKGHLLLEPDDWKTISKNMTAAKLDKIATAAMKLNRMKDQETKIKN